MPRNASSLHQRRLLQQWRYGCCCEYWIVIGTSETDRHSLHVDDEIDSGNYKRTSQQAELLAAIKGLDIISAQTTSSFSFASFVSFLSSFLVYFAACAICAVTSSNFCLLSSGFPFPSGRSDRHEATNKDSHTHILDNTTLNNVGHF
jgi:hypothetical protein